MRLPRDTFARRRLTVTSFKRFKFHYTFPASTRYLIFLYLFRCLRSTTHVASVMETNFDDTVIIYPTTVWRRVIFRRSDVRSEVRREITLPVINKHLTHHFIHPHIFICIHTWRTFSFGCYCVWLHVSWISQHIRIDIHIYIYIYIKYTCRYTYIYICIYIYSSTCMCTYVQIYFHLKMYT